MLLLESYARNYWKMQSKYLTDKPATRKLVELLVQRNDKFSRQVLVEMMQFREEETKSGPSIDDLTKEYDKISEEITKLIEQLLGKGDKFRTTMEVPNKDKVMPSQDMTVLVAKDIESTIIIKKIKEDLSIADNLVKKINDKGGTIIRDYPRVRDPKTHYLIYNIAVTLREVHDDKNAKSALGKILMFFGVNFKSLWEKLTTKYKLPFWGSIILGLILVALITIYKYGKENAVVKVIKNVLIAAITGFALYNLIVLIMSLKDQFSKEETLIHPY
jgi:ribosomal protein L18E